MAVLSFIVAFALRNRAVVLLASVLFIAIGVRAAVTLPVDAVPDITNVQVQIITASPALGPTEIEKIVTIPVERALAGIPKATEVRSVSKYGLSVVTVVFQDGTDIYFARQQVNERMREAQEAIPAGYGRPEMGPNSGGLGEIFQFTVENDALTLMQKEEVLDWQVAPALRTVPGIVEVNSFGGEDRQYQIELDPGRMQAAGLSTAQVVEALQKANANAGGGYLEANREHVVIGTDGLVRSLDDLRNVVIAATHEGVPITLAAVADVRFGGRLRRGAATRDGKGETVLGVAMMLLGENSRTVTAAVKAKLAAIEPSLPPGTKLVPFYDRSVLVNRTTRTVGKNLVEGAVLVVVVLLVLLGDLRAGLVVAVVIPLSLLFAVTAMNALGLSGNLMSLGAIDFGLLVDGAVIIVENAERRLSEARQQRGRDLTDEERTLVVETATLEVRSASLFGEAILTIVYLPLLALTGIEGKMFRPMATTVLLALAGAFVLSLTVVPVLTSMVLVPRKEHHETWLLRKIHAAFVPVLGQAFKRRAFAVGGAVAVLAIAVACGTRLGAEFIPQLDEGDMLVEARRLPGAALTETVRTDLELQRACEGRDRCLRLADQGDPPAVARRAVLPRRPFVIVARCAVGGTPVPWDTRRARPPSPQVEPVSWRPHDHPLRGALLFFVERPLSRRRALELRELRASAREEHPRSRGNDLLARRRVRDGAVRRRSRHQRSALHAQVHLGLQGRRPVHHARARPLRLRAPARRPLPVVPARLRLPVPRRQVHHPGRREVLWP